VELRDGDQHRLAELVFQGAGSPESGSLTST